MLGLWRRRRFLQPRPRRGVDLQEPEDGAEEAAGVVRPELRVGGGVLSAAGGAAAAAGALVVGGGGRGGGGAEEDGLVDLRLAERERQQGPRRVALRRRQRRRHGAAGLGRRFGGTRVAWQSAAGVWGFLWRGDLGLLAFAWRSRRRCRRQRFLYAVLSERDGQI